jgi:TPR repeat protein
LVSSFKGWGRVLLPTPPKSSKLIPVRKLIATLCLIISMLLQSVGVGESADFQKGLIAAQSGDYETALREWKPLAEQGDAGAQQSLGVMYHNGNGVKQNYKTAVNWYKLAAEQRDSDAQGNLGAMYAFGRGVLKDYVYAHMWGNIAVSIGGKDKGKVRDFVEKKMTPSQLEKAQDLARKCVRKKYKRC